VFGEQINDLSLSFVAPLGPDDYDGFGHWCWVVRV
jgi:hypothetical protein